MHGIQGSRTLKKKKKDPGKKKLMTDCPSRTMTLPFLLPQLPLHLGVATGLRFWLTWYNWGEHV